MNTQSKTKLKTYAVSILITLGVGIAAALITMKSMKAYGALDKPPLSPPAWLFPVVWTILYSLMAVSAARVRLERREDFPLPIKLYALQLGLNFLWPILFFALGLRLAAFVVLIMLLAAVILMTIEFRKYDKPAAYMQIPYMAWLVFAGYLNLAVYLLNG